MANKSWLEYMAGGNAVAVVSEPFTQPLFRGTVIVSTAQAALFFVGQRLSVEGGGGYLVTAVTATSLTLQNDGIGNAEAGATIAAGKLISQSYVRPSRRSPFPASYLLGYNFDGEFGTTLVPNVGSAGPTNDVQYSSSSAVDSEYYGWSLGQPTPMGSGLNYQTALVGTNTGYVLNSTGLVSGQSALTVELFVKPFAVGAFQKTICQKAGVFSVYFDNSDYLNFQVITGAGTGVSTILGNVFKRANGSDWFHIMCTYDGANMRTFVNGDLYARTAKTGALVTNANIISLFTSAIQIPPPSSTGAGSCAIARFGLSYDAKNLSYARSVVRDANGWPPS